MGDARQQPMAVDRRVPVVAAEERRGQFAGRSDVLVRVQDLDVTNAMPETPDHGEFEVGAGMRVDDMLYSAITGIGRLADQHFNFIQGPLHFTYDNTKIEPRGNPPKGSATDSTIRIPSDAQRIVVSRFHCGGRPACSSE